MCTARTVVAAWVPYHCAMGMTLPVAVDFGRFHSHDDAAWCAARPGATRAASLVDRSGRPLDLTQTFTMSDDRDEMAHFLRTTGYLVVRGAFEPHEIDEFNALVAVEKTTARAGDNRSWWATDADGHEV